MKHAFRSNISVGKTHLTARDIRALALADPSVFAEKIVSGAESGSLRLAQLNDIRALYQNLADVQVPVSMNIGGTTRTVTAGAFPILIGSTAVAAINESYQAVETIGQDLVTEFEDAAKITTFAAVDSLDIEKDEVKELEDFPEVGTAEESVQIGHRKNGRKLSLSVETLMENNVAGFLEKINKLGEIAAEHVEELTLERVTDYYGSKSSPAAPYVYRPEGSGTSLFSNTANTPGTRAPLGTQIQSNALADETDLDAARIRLAGMKNARGKRMNIPWSNVMLLVPTALIGVALKIFNSEYVPGDVNEFSNYGPRGRWWMSADRIKSTPKLDDLSASAWYLGAFQKQFKRKWKMRMEYVTLGTDTQAYLNSQVAFQARIAWDVEVGAVDYVYVVQNLSGTTAPADE